MFINVDPMERKGLYSPDEIKGQRYKKIDIKL